MAESRDLAFRLFGKAIHIPVGVGVLSSIAEEIVGAGDKVHLNNEETPTSTDEEQKSEESNDSHNEDKISQKSSSPENSKAEDETNESNNDLENNKSNKKPDKMLPCPRCKSMETKFCYYNNYNINQPRHFCKNCQRYWTAGGTMRNVPVGAGRRKSKSSVSNQHFRHITIPDYVQPLKSDGMVLSFGSEAPLYKIEENLSGSPNSNEQTKVSTDLNVSNFSGNVWANQWTNTPFAFPFYPIPAYWSMPWISPSSGSLGKHSREGNLLNSFKAFKSGGEDKIRSSEISQFMLANPAALSRSFNFQERS